MKRFLLTMCLLHVVSAFGKDYYVSPSGNDSYAGTNWAKPFRTVSMGIYNRLPGDVVHLTNGAVFNENVYFGAGGGTGGTAGNPVTLTCDDPVNRATIYQSNVAKDGLLVYNTSYVSVRNLVITGQGPSATSKFGLTAQSYLGGKLSGLTFSNITVSGFHDGIVLSAYGNPADGFNNTLIQSCQASNNLNSGGYTFGLAVGAISNIVLRGCTFNHNLGDPTASGNTGSGFVFAQTVDGLMEYCVAHDNGGAGTNGAGPVGLWCYDSKRITIQFCESYLNQAQNQDGDGFDLDLGTSDSVIQYCYSHDNFGAGYLLSTDGNLTIWSNNIVRYCISENDSTGPYMGAIELYCAAGPVPLKNSQVYGNTIYSRLSPAIAFNINNANMSGVYLRNNLIITTNNQNLISLIAGSSSPTTNQVCFQGNNYWSSGNPFRIQTAPASFATSMNAWRVASGQEKLSGTNVGFNVDPKLIAAGAGGTIGNAYALTNLAAYRLQPSSPMINAGLNLTNLFNLNPGTIDFYGTPIPQMGFFDIGAAEFALTPTATILTNALNPSVYGQGVTFTAMVKTNGVTATSATSNFVFKVDGIAVATNVATGGLANYTNFNLTAGTHNVTAEYRGDTSFAPSTNSVTQTVNQQTPTLTAPSANTITNGQMLSASSLTGGAATNAASGAPVPGGFAFTNPSLVPNIGTTNVSVTFSPVDTTNYTTATTTVSVVVNAGQSIVISSGKMLAGGSFQLNFTGSSGQAFRVLGTNLLTAPLTNWPTLMSGIFGIGGPVITNYTEASATNTQRFYRIVSP
jgi:Bacterial Ig-like domain (group 3)/Right handed beta helix region